MLERTQLFIISLFSILEMAQAQVDLSIKKIQTPQPNPRAPRVIIAFTEAQNEISKMLGKSIYDPFISEKLDLKYWYAGNNSASIYNLKQIISAVKFDCGIDNFIDSL